MQSSHFAGIRQQCYEAFCIYTVVNQTRDRDAHIRLQQVLVESEKVEDKNLISSNDLD